METRYRSGVDRECRTRRWHQNPQTSEEKQQQRLRDWGEPWPKGRVAPGGLASS